MSRTVYLVTVREAYNNRDIMNRIVFTNYAKALKHYTQEKKRLIEQTAGDNEFTSKELAEYIDEVSCEEYIDGKEREVNDTETAWVINLEPVKQIQ